MTDSDRLFTETRPPGLPADARPQEPYGDIVLHPCPECGERKLIWWRLALADCDCGYTWERSAQLHHSEELPY